VSKIILSGIKPTGKPHLGNYVGMLKPALQMAEEDGNESYYFIPDYHALNSVQNRETLETMVYEVAASYLALGLNPDRTILYKQSDIPEIFEVNCALSCVCPKGFMNRAHAYKAAITERTEAGSKDPDTAINMGLFNYPILMAADILTFDADIVPVGKDQQQHVEYARDLALKFNHVFGEVFTVPIIYIREDIPILPGLDGRKMSKSYRNTLPLFSSPDELRKAIFRIKTDSKAPGDPKELQGNLIYTYYKEIGSPDEMQAFAELLQTGLSYADAKQMLFERMDQFLAEPRQKFFEFIANRTEVKKILKDGAVRARERASVVLERVKKATGMF
jgi:tryptophanyl-tRNA synthetase